jgi:hypothetical protein
MFFITAVEWETFRVFRPGQAHDEQISGQGFRHSSTISTCHLPVPRNQRLCEYCSQIMLSYLQQPTSLDAAASVQ